MSPTLLQTLQILNALAKALGSSAATPALVCSVLVQAPSLAHEVPFMGKGLHCLLCLLVSLCEFPLPAVTKYYKPSGLKEHEFVILLFWRSEVQNGSHWIDTKVSAGLHSFWRPKGRIHVLAFWKRFSHSLACGHITLTLLLSSCPFSYCEPPAFPL